MNEYKKKEFDKWQQLAVNDVIIYRYDPDDDNTDFIAVIRSKTDTEVQFDDIHSLGSLEAQFEDKITVNAANVDIFVFKRFLFNQPSIIDMVSSKYPEYFL